MTMTEREARKRINERIATKKLAAIEVNMERKEWRLHCIGLYMSMLKSSMCLGFGVRLVPIPCHCGC